MIIALIRRAARDRILYPIVGRVLDRYIAWLRDQAEWEGIVSGVAHALIETQTAVGARTLVAEAMRVVGPYLSQDSLEVLRLIDDVARKHSPEAN